MLMLLFTASGCAILILMQSLGIDIPLAVGLPEHSNNALLSIANKHQDTPSPQAQDTPQSHIDEAVRLIEIWGKKIVEFGYDKRIVQGFWLPKSDFFEEINILAEIDDRSRQTLEAGIAVREMSKLGVVIPDESELLTPYDINPENYLYLASALAHYQRPFMPTLSYAIDLKESVLETWLDPNCLYTIACGQKVEFFSGHTGQETL